MPEREIIRHEARLLFACVAVLLALPVASEDERSAKKINTQPATPGLALPARFDHTRIELGDRRDNARDGNYRFERFNTAAGISWQWSETVSSYAGYSETSAGKGCEYIGRPCRFPPAFFSGPSLQPIVTKTFEAGVYGHVPQSAAVSMRWSVAPFVTVSEGDIAFVSTRPASGSGYFDNVGKTQRTGIEAAVFASNGRLRWFANYAYIRATYEDSFLVLSEHKPAANADGEVQVDKRDRLPTIPLHSAKMGISYALTSRWQIGLDSITTSSRVLRGDDGNDELHVEGFTILSARGSYRIADNFEAFILAENILDTEYETFGTFDDIGEVALHAFDYPASDPRFLGPGAPRGIWLGLRFSR